MARLGRLYSRRMATPVILFLTKQRTAASMRYRALAYFDRLRDAGWEPRALAADDDEAGALSTLAAARRAHTVVVCRRTYHEPFRRLLRAVSRRLIFDFDDAIFTRPEGPSPGRERRFAAMLRLCDQAWAGNGYLADAARPYCKDVRVMPTSIFPSLYDTFAEKPTATFDVVWIGSSSTRPYIEGLLPALELAAARVPNLRLKIVADFALHSERLTAIAERWSGETEAAALASSHVGLAPLVDDGWTRGKCGLKVLQYMAARLPVVTSPVGANREIVIEGGTGLYADSPAAWADAIVRLAGDAALRDRMGDAGRRRVEAHYSLDATAAKMLEALRA